MWELLALHVLVGWGAGWRGGQPAGVPVPTIAGAVGTPLLTPYSRHPLPLHLRQAVVWVFGPAHGSANAGGRVEGGLRAGGGEGPSEARKQQGAHSVYGPQSLWEAFVLLSLELWVPA